MENFNYDNFIKEKIEIFFFKIGFELYSLYQNSHPYPQKFILFVKQKNTRMSIINKKYLY